MAIGTQDIKIMTEKILVREMDEGDWPRVWDMLQRVVRDGETYTYPRDMDENLGRSLWCPAGKWTNLVACNDDCHIIGAAKVGPNQLGPGAHVSTASFIVDRNSRGLGAGRLLLEAALRHAQASGYCSMQFNAVVETNHHAVALWQSAGFRVIGTVPGAFQHPVNGKVGLHIMYKSFGNA
jgi:L-amino acid N-acyltransferase YncA